MAMSTWSRLTRYKRYCRRLKQSAASCRTFISQAAVVDSCTLPRIIIIRRMRQLHDYVDLVLFYVASALLVTPITLTNYLFSSKRT